VNIIFYIKKKCYNYLKKCVLFAPLFIMPKFIRKLRMDNKDKWSCNKTVSFQNIIFVSRRMEEHITHLQQQCLNKCHINSVTTTVSKQQCHNNSVTTTVSRQQCHNNSITTTVSQQQSHNNSVTSTVSQQQRHSTVSQQQRHNNSVTTTVSQQLYAPLWFGIHKGLNRILFHSNINALVL